MSRPPQASRVTVVVTTYNQAAAVRKAITSVARQTVPTELIVIDDCSTDKTAGIAEEATLAAGGHFEALAHNSGVAAARNRGIELATGNYVMFLDGDDWLEPTKLEQQLRVFREYPDTDVCYCDAKIVRRGVAEAQTLKDYWPVHEDDILLRLLQGNCIAVHAALVPIKLARETLFATELRRAEDWDFWLRLAQKGAIFRFLDEPLVAYRRDGHTLSRDTVSQLKAAWTVLERIDPSRLTPAQAAARSRYRQGILLAQADLAIRSGKHVERVPVWFDQAAGLGAIGAYRRLTRRLWRFSVPLARLAYLAASAMAAAKNRHRHLG